MDSSKRRAPTSDGTSSGGTEVSRQPDVLCGESGAVRRLRGALATAAQASCVRLLAEPGMDVADIAEAIHVASGRPGALVAVNAAPSDPSAVEYTLFGTEIGRPLDGLEIAQSPGLLVEAANGTLFVERLGDLPVATQARLGRVLANGTLGVRRAGEGRAESAMMSLVVGGHDRDSSDVAPALRVHLDRATIVVAPLRQRAEDIPVIADRIVDRLCAAAEIGARSMTSGASAVLRALPWPGNLDDLRAVLAQAIERSEHETIRLEDIVAAARFDRLFPVPVPAATLRAARRQFEREYISRVLAYHGWAVRDAARTLGIERTNLYRKARELGIAVTRVRQLS